MESSVSQQLQAMSAEFYRVHADSFAETRQNGWASWEKVMQIASTVSKPKNVLDLGCGNGRFVQFFRDVVAEPSAYLGIDSEEQLIEKARQQFPNEIFKVQTIDEALVDPIEANLVVSFGVFHHLPGRDYRAEVLNRLAAAMSPNSVAVLSFWQPKLLANFEAKVLPEPNIVGLEANDFVMSWGGKFA